MVRVVRLSELRPGQKGIVQQIEGPSGIRRRLLDMGLVRGTEIRVIREAPLADPVEYEVRGYNLSLRREEAVCVLVELIEEEVVALENALSHAVRRRGSGHSKRSG